MASWCNVALALKPIQASLWWSVFVTPFAASTLEWVILMSRHRDQLRHVTVIVVNGRSKSRHSVQVKNYVDHGQGCHWVPVFGAGLEFPSLDSFHCFLVQAFSQSANHCNVTGAAVSLNN